MSKIIKYIYIEREKGFHVQYCKVRCANTSAEAVVSRERYDIISRADIEKMYGVKLEPTQWVIVEAHFEVVSRSSNGNTGDPQPQERHRSITRGGKTWQYDPSKKAKRMFWLKLQAGNQQEVAWIQKLMQNDKPITLQMLFVMPRFKKPQKSSEPLTKSSSDVDNLAKFVMDALTKNLYEDDAQVCTLIVTKRFVEGDEVPYTRITMGW
jgi:Holliday junction resolvase RusA-like endonuclease